MFVQPTYRPTVWFILWPWSCGKLMKLTLWIALVSSRPVQISLPVHWCYCSSLFYQHIKITSDEDLRDNGNSRDHEPPAWLLRNVSDLRTVNKVCYLIEWQKMSMRSKPYSLKNPGYYYQYAVPTKLESLALFQSQDSKTEIKFVAAWVNRGT